jgi:MOSC domain-containing protein YiiM
MSERTKHNPVPHRFDCFRPGRSCAPLGTRQVPSAFVKKPISGRVMVERLGLVGDQRADPRLTAVPTKQCTVTQSSTTPDG